jgi:hypothetical protein
MVVRHILGCECGRCKFVIYGFGLRWFGNENRDRKSYAGKGVNLRKLLERKLRAVEVIHESE